MKQFVLDHLAEECRRVDHRLRAPYDANDADLMIELADGKRVAVYIINRAIRIPEIRERFEQNTRGRMHTLFVVDGRMMPADKAQFDPPHWMAALHALAHGRVYAYWCDRRAVTIRPIHFDWKWGSSSRLVEYGAPIDVGTLRAAMISTATKAITGQFATADFGEGAFWKKRDPNENRQFQYSWRDWSFGSRKRRSAEEAEPSWDPWEEFERQYGDIGAEDIGAGFGFGGEFGGAYSRRAANDRKAQIVAQHYETLGLPRSASFEEIKQAYRRKAREYHPDLHPTEKDKYTAKMAEINAAFEALSRQLKP